jgi:hypothetical protein
MNDKRAAAKSRGSDKGLLDHQYHVALSFAGEDREYVRQVATHLDSQGVEVFYDEFEKAELWGKNLYDHLRDVYENKALFTVMFISEDYKNKVWTNHERESAQARAFSSNREYILPAFFDTSVKVPGLPTTIGHISLAGLAPEGFASLIIEKLRGSGVQLSSQFSYSDEAKADVDFPRPPGTEVAEILNALKSRDWFIQRPAIDLIFKLDWKSLDKNQIFVLGRNIYQSACGTERKALAVLTNLRQTLAGIPEMAAAHLLNGMFYEVYFDKKGLFRGTDSIKGEGLDKLLALQIIKKFEPSVTFIRRALQPYKSKLPFLPSMTPENVIFEVTLELSDPPLIKSLKFRDHELLVAIDDGADIPIRTWKLSHINFTVQQLKASLAEAWSIPPEQLELHNSQHLEPGMEYRFPNGHYLVWPA